LGHSVAAAHQSREFTEAGGLISFAKPRGLTIPLPLLARADEVIE